MKKKSKKRGAPKKTVMVIGSKPTRIRNKVYRQYIEQEKEKTAKIYRELQESRTASLSLETLYPEYDLGSKVVGVFDKWSSRETKLVDLFPFYEHVFCLVELAAASSEKHFNSLFGCTYKQFLELVEMGKVIPLLSSATHLKDSQCKFFQDLFELQPPLNNRCLEILREDFFQEVVAKETQVSAVIGESSKLLFKATTKVFDQLEIKEPLATSLYALLQRPLERGDIAQAFRNLEYIVTWMKSDPENKNSLGPWLLEVENWHRQPYVAPGAALNYSEHALGQLQEDARYMEGYLEAILSNIPNVNGDAINEFVLFADSAPVLSGERLAILKEKYFYEPPEFYSDPVKFANWLSKSDNIKEHYNIARTLHADIEMGKFKEAFSIVEQDKYKRVIEEINREIRLLEKSSRFFDVSVQFGASLIGAITGAFVEQQLQSGEIPLLFSFLGATAFASLMKDHSKNVANKALVPYFRKSNTSLMIWKSSGYKR